MTEIIGIAIAVFAGILAVGLIGILPIMTGGKCGSSHDLSDELKYMRYLERQRKKGK